jgi:hypothetical protein
MMQCTIRYNDGRPDNHHNSIQAAMQALLAEYPDGVAVDAGGCECDADTADDCYDVRSGRAALVWRSADDAGPVGLGDDGSKAVAEIAVGDDE